LNYGEKSVPFIIFKISSREKPPRCLNLLRDPACPPRDHQRSRLLLKTDDYKQVRGVDLPLQGRNHKKYFLVIKKLKFASLSQSFPRIRQWTTHKSNFHRKSLAD